MRRSGSPREEGPIRRERGKGGASTTRLVHGIQGMEKDWTSRGSADGNGNGSPCCAELARSSRKTVRPIAMLARTPPETWSRGRGKILCYVVIQRERQGLACTWKSDRGHQRSVDFRGAIACNENFNNARSTKKPCHRTFMKKEPSLCSRNARGTVTSALVGAAVSLARVGLGCTSMHPTNQLNAFERLGNKNTRSTLSDIAICISISKRSFLTKSYTLYSIRLVLPHGYRRGSLGGCMAPPFKRRRAKLPRLSFDGDHTIWEGC